jgi:hypothetical protein
MTIVEEAKALLADGYFQTSRKYCDLARLPPGKTGREALFEASMREYLGLTNEVYWQREMHRWAFGMSEDAATDHYLRCYARTDLRKTVSPEVMRAFRQLGGRTAR